MKEERDLEKVYTNDEFVEKLRRLADCIENGKQIRKLNTRETAYGNFYMQPNGVFYLTANNRAAVVKTNDFVLTDNVKYATQSGPMLVIDGELHANFKKGSTNVKVRNGVGVLPDGKILFAMAKKRINFYDFAMFFKKKGCTNALYLDGFVSRTYLPTEGLDDLGGRFGVIIGEVRDKKSE